MSKRLLCIDLARGIAILMFVCAHCINFHSKWTDFWIMPVFFVLMGVFYNPKGSLKEMCISKVDALLIPCLFFALISMVVKLCIGGYTPMRILKLIVNPYETVNGPAWFAICTFWIYLILEISCLFKHPWHRILFILSLSLIGYYMSSFRISGHRIYLPFFISTAMTCSLFAALGVVIKDIIKSPLLSAKNILATFVSLLLVVVWGGVIHSATSAYIQNYYVLEYPVLIIMGVSGTMAVIGVLKILPSVNVRIKYEFNFSPYIIDAFGRLSLIVLLCHGPLLTVFRNWFSGMIVIC